MRQIVAVCVLSVGCQDLRQAGMGEGPPVTVDPAMPMTMSPTQGQPWAPMGDDPPLNPFQADSPWPQPHRNGGAQASTPLRALEDNNVDIQTRNFIKDANIQRDFLLKPVPQTSPFMVYGSKKYADSPNSRVLWAVSLTDVYKYDINGPPTRFVGNAQMNSSSLSIPWNLTLLAGDRLIVPQPLGARLTSNPECNGSRPALLEFVDGPNIDSKPVCKKKFEFTDAVVSQCLKPSGSAVDPRKLRYSIAFSAVTFTGELVTNLVVASDTPGAPDTLYFAVIDHSLSTMKSCQFANETTISNQISTERISETKTAIYGATETAMVKFTYDASVGMLTKNWSRPIAVRRRTGTTPTMLGFGAGEKFIAVIDAPCAVTDVFQGTIECAADTSPAKVVAVRREDDVDQVYTFELPSEIRTVENSPSGLDYDLVIANYSGYVPDPKAKGVADVYWDTVKKSFQLRWFNGTVNMNGVTCQSRGSNLVYSSGADETLDYALYGIRLKADSQGPAGEVVVKIKLAAKADINSVFDPGNSFMINDDRSVVWSSNEGIVRVRPL